MTKPDTHYSHPRLAEVYDASNGWSVDRDFYLSLAGESPIRILDLGCGTGLICDACAARGHQVVGVDPAENMLEVARKKPHGNKVDWIQGDAQSFTIDQKFDLIIMTGHAFQVLLEEQDVRACFQMMKKHLANGGRAVFETRNPKID